ncbi:MAG: 4-deoxy-4-formamido-L-arabinose-phosphoundecaprenol deformylase [Planctomycetes bacterium]|nr:4-deoxy-4-formamido-L-arabinose-phosphoundecaprenol deformylase [Planctomycetota bacterium]
MKRLCLKVDVDTHDGMRDGVPKLVEICGRHGIPATFFLSFGPDNAGKAIFNLLRPGFLKKMLRTSAPSMYGLRTVLSGTLLPARPIATKFPDIVRATEAAGHEIGVHAWDHRRWQDHVWKMEPSEISQHFERSFEAFEAILGHPPAGIAAPAWAVTAQSLALEDKLGLVYASDLRGGPICTLRAGGVELATPQIPTTGRCIEELLAAGVSDENAVLDAIFADLEGAEPAVLAVHAEVEGGPFAALFEKLLARVIGSGVEIVTLESIARTLERASLPRRELAHIELPGRAGLVSSSSNGVHK